MQPSIFSKNANLRTDPCQHENLAQDRHSHRVLVPKKGRMTNEIGRIDGFKKSKNASSLEEPDHHQATHTQHDAPPDRRTNSTTSLVPKQKCQQKGIHSKIYC